MPGDHLSRDAITTESGAGAGKRPHRAALALLAMGAPLAAAAPAAAQAGGAEQPPNGHVEAQAGVKAAADASAGTNGAKPEPSGRSISTSTDLANGSVSAPNATDDHRCSLFRAVAWPVAG